MCQIRFISPSPSCSTACIFRFLERSKYSSILLLFIILTLLSTTTAKSATRYILCFWIRYYLLSQAVWSRVGNLFVFQHSSRIYAFHSPGLLWFVYVLFDNIVLFQFLARFRVDHLPHPVMSNLILLFR